MNRLQEGVSDTPIPDWNNQDLVLYHGTTLGYARNIVEEGVNLKNAQPFSDFGKGFYTTTNRHQAMQFTRTSRKLARKEGGLVEFTVNRASIGSLQSIHFVLGSTEAVDFWSLVNFNRDVMLNHPDFPCDLNFYDVAYGPVAKNWSELTLYAGYDQVSFHTADALALLNTSDRRRIL